MNSFYYVILTENSTACCLKNEAGGNEDCLHRSDGLRLWDEKGLNCVPTNQTPGEREDSNLLYFLTTEHTHFLKCLYMSNLL